MSTATDITIEDVIARPGVGKTDPKQVFFAIRYVHGHTGDGATLFEVSGALLEKDTRLSDEQIARCFVLLREKGLIEEHGHTDEGRLIVVPTK